MKIFSPVAHGNGSFIVHKLLEKNIKGYKVLEYNPYLTLFPPLLSLFGDNHADIIHAPIDYACFSKNKNKPLVTTVHGYMLDDDVINGGGLIRKLHYKTDLKYFIKKSICNSSKIVCVSEFLKKKIIQNYGNENKIEVIHNGIDTSVFKPKINKSKSNNKITILFVGNLKKAKGIHILPKLLDILGERFELVYTEGLKNNGNLIKHPKARSAGSINHRDMPDLYNSADLLLSASLREGFGLAIAEAMACGLPVIAANNSAIPELVENGMNGFLCDDINAEVYAEKIMVLFENNVKRNEISEYNRSKIVQKFNIDKMIDNYESLFERTLSS